MIILEILKWVAVGLFILATIAMYNQNIAAKSKIPWILFIIGNIIWLVDSFITHNYQWVVLSVIYMLLDGGILIQRIRNQNVIA